MKVHILYFELPRSDYACIMSVHATKELAEKELNKRVAANPNYEKAEWFTITEWEVEQ
jgi:hypothetical protein